MKLKATAGALVMALALIPLEASAEPTLEQYLGAAGPLRQQMTIWLTGVENGLTWASIADEQERAGKRLYCAPRAYELTPTQLDQVLRSYIKEYPPGALASGKAGFFVLKSLQSAFPCS